jgi:hypothetical protein
MGPQWLACMTHIGAVPLVKGELGDNSVHIFQKILNIFWENEDAHACLYKKTTLSSLHNTA